jgi:hypothetical protein
MTTLMRNLFLGLLLFHCIGEAQEEDEYTKWLKQQQSDYKKFTEEQDREFSEFLKKEWRGMQLMRGELPDSTPKPRVLPAAVPKPGPPVDSTARQPVVSIPRVVPPPAPPPLPSAPAIDASANMLTLRFSFFDAPIELRYNNSLCVPFDRAPDNESISAYWSTTNPAQAVDVLKQLQFERVRLKLNDWGYILLINAVGKQLFGTADNARTLFVWQLLVRSEFDARVGYTGGRVYLLLPAKTRLFAVPFFSFAAGEGRYYAVRFETSEKVPMGQIFAYEGRYAQASRPVDFTMQESPRLTQTDVRKRLTFTHMGKKISVDVVVNDGIVKFLRDYPQTEFPVYFGAAPSPEATRSLIEGLRPMVEGKTEVEAVDLLLHFTQTAFGYKTDKDNFGWEKPLFPDETLYYPYSDCEDRAVLFAYLVRTLTGLDVVGLDYPAHIATAVKFRKPVSGDAVTYDNARWLICDPTYMNADAGMCMPNFKNVQPSVIAWKSP